MDKQRVLVDLTTASGLDLRGHVVLPRTADIGGVLDGSSGSFLFEPEGGDQTLFPAWALQSARVAGGIEGGPATACEDIIAAWLSTFAGDTTRRKFGPTARRFVALLAARGVGLQTASEAQCREAIQALVADVSANTARQYLVRIRSFLAHVHRRGLVRANLAGSLDVPVPEHKRGPVVGAAELSRLFEVMSGWDRLLCAVMIAGDLQPQEVVSLCWGDVTRLASGVIQLAIAGKRRRVRRVLLPRAIGSRLLSMRGSAPASLPVFAARTGTRLAAAGVNGRIRQAAERAGLDPAINGRALRRYGSALECPGLLEKYLGSGRD
ncbi:MAG TPA: tyrosine-type recombinase/integrase [Hyphomicrobiaceae bacterium]|nr:tyrosine-type recombinase/integrase [Hyphomicrobiaceae bacterium]